MVGTDPCVDLLDIPLVGIWGCMGYFPGIAKSQFRGIQNIPRLSDLSTVTYKYRLMDIDIVVVGRAESRVWWDTRDLVFVLDLSSPILANLPILADIVKDYALRLRTGLRGSLQT